MILCPVCNRECEFITRYGRYYCNHCGDYTPSMFADCTKAKPFLPNNAGYRIFDLKDLFDRVGIFGQGTYRVKIAEVPEIVFTVPLGRNWTSDSQSLDNLIDTSGRLTVNTATNVTEEYETATASNITMQIGSVGEMYELRNVSLGFDCDSNAGDRSLTFSLNMGQTGGGAVSYQWVSNAVSLQADEVGCIFLGQNGFVSYNDNESITLDDGTKPSPLPVDILGGSNVLAGKATGQKAGDAMTLSATVRKL